MTKWTNRWAGYSRKRKTLALDALVFAQVLDNALADLATSVDGLDLVPVGIAGLATNLSYLVAVEYHGPAIEDYPL